MFIKKRSIVILAFLMLVVFNMNAQFTIDADLKTRFEYRHGFNNLFPDDADPAAFVGQRTRLNLGYTHEKLKLFVSVQDVSTWGDTRQILPNDGNDSFSLFQAWAQLLLDEQWSIKAGRQVISYDDQRIFGGLDWALQGRFHDAALIKYQNKNHGIKADLGFAFSQENQKNEGTEFNISGFFTYKAMQYLHFNKSWEKSTLSALFLNTGFQKFTGDDNDIPDGTFYRQTAGVYFKFPIKNVNVTGSSYYQFGKANATTDLSAYQASIEGTYKTGKVLMGLGFETLSGTDQDGATENNSFFPLYGTNHKFNGFMDYFYVGNHANNVGLNDAYAKLVFTTGAKSNLLLKGHYFAAQADLTGDADKYLGTEIDLVYNQKLMKNVKLSVGYSHMFASDSMSLIKGGRPSDNVNNWAWVQLVIRPNLFTSNFKKN